VRQYSANSVPLAESLQQESKGDFIATGQPCALSLMLLAYKKK
jgi:hypothetical protein